MYSKEITQKFLEKYKEFETIRENDFRRFSYYQKKFPDTFELFRNMRNNLAHNTVSGEFPYCVSEEVLDEISKLVDTMKERLIERSIHFRNLKYATLDSKVLDVVRLMTYTKFEYIPVIEDGFIRHVFSSKVLLHYVNDHHTISEDLKMKDIKDYLSVESFRFYPLKTYTYEVEDLFKRFFDGKRISVIFITENGNNDERILGMVTSYEV